MDAGASESARRSRRILHYSGSIVALLALCPASLASALSAVQQRRDLTFIDLAI